MDDSTLWFISGIALFIVGIMAYIGFMIFLPEWVGITGDTARKAEQSHRSGDVAQDDDLTERWQSKNGPSDSQNS
ncbi:MAG: hypothetical protein RBT63_08265 [Bdellovibrionales bacterium]|jgi:hypothetical protein|nr:hypothetical protein [Bdellovibrionales bacterium]